MLTQSIPMFEAAPRYVRVEGRTPEGFVMFAFSVNDPEVNVDLIMPEPMFDAFCTVNRVRFLAPDTANQHEAL